MTLILGGNVDVPTTGTIVRMKVPPQTQNGKVFRLRGKGAPALNNPERRGDQHVTVRAEIPTNLSAAQITLVQELRQLAQPDNYPEARHFWERAKD
jgi:DnaJ-class molecular chaperone